MVGLVWLMAVGCMAGGLYVALRGDLIPGTVLLLMGVVLGPGASHLLQ